MANRFPNQTCVFCTRPSVGVGEHVWPHWFIGDFHGQGPFTTSRAGVPYTKRDKVTPLTTNSLQGVHVPACEQCNAVLDTTIEKPAKPLVRRLMDHRDSSDELLLTADECATLARWILKVGILAAHPAADHDHPGLQRDPEVSGLDFVRSEWLDWLRAGSPPPDGFSVFITRRSLRGEAAEPDVKQKIVLPRVAVEGEDLDFMSRSFGFSGVNATIVWHPGWPISHAQVDSGRALRLWPHPTEADFGALPIVHPKELAFWDGSIGVRMFSSDEYASGTEVPLSVGSDHFSAFFGGEIPPTPNTDQ
ncbi:hypothetical protein OVA26_17325 [Microbacterium sp. SL62]|uniref:hypothetical protein n=1 Tax=Microbacterium sp. SL62 TaxID=2995139 RepID=UPI0022747E19|nr:hypothetical protein [Microbacterium sp. SL62]MCY1718700.1 hypothetical protein [Microbacterium sp. SL62]